MNATTLIDLFRFHSEPYPHQTAELERSLSPEAQKILSDRITFKRPDISPEGLTSVYLSYLKADEPRFQLDKHNKPVINKLVDYLRQDPLKKGFMLSGPVGTGKTLLIRSYVKLHRVLSLITTHYEGHMKIYPSYEIVDKFFAQGYDMFTQVNLRDVIIDDLGAEATISHFGNNVNPVSEFILRSYDKKWRELHCTTNLGPDSLKNKYDARVYSRMKELFEVVILNGDDRRK